MLRRKARGLAPTGGQKVGPQYNAPKHGHVGCMDGWTDTERAKLFEKAKAQHPTQGLFSVME